MPVSTTHAITASIMGVGAAKRFSALKMGVVKSILLAWVLTLPVLGGAVELGTWQSVVVVDPNRENDVRTVRLSFVSA